MNRKPLFALLALGALFASGCGTDHSGSYKGEATESGAVKISVPQTTNVAKNESPPRKIPDAAVTVAKDGGGYAVKFGTCEMKGETSTQSLIVAKGECNVKIANWEGKLPLSATLNFGEGGAVSMDVTGTTKNDTTVVSYDWTFKGKK